MRNTSCRAAVIAAVLALGACGAAVPPVQGKGGPAWVELTSEHFTVWTDGDLERVREQVREMEYLRQLVVGVMFPSAPASGRMLVIALRDDEELAAFASTGSPRPFAMSAHPPLRQPLIVMSAFSNRDNDALAHELTHVISFGVLENQPRWLAEGMAQFFETVRYSADGTSADVGDAPRSRGQAQVKAHLVPVANLLKWRGLSNNESHEYSTAWALFTFLYNAHGDELNSYFRTLDGEVREGDTQDALRIWNESFRSLPISDVDVALREWLVTGNHVVTHVKVQRREGPVRERALADADTHAIRGMLRLEAGQRGPARIEVAAALELDPHNVLAQLLIVALDNKLITIEQARSLVAAHPDDWRAWWLDALAIDEAHGDPAEREAARAKTCEMVAQNAALAPPRPMCTARGDRDGKPARETAGGMPAADRSQVEQAERLFAKGDASAAAAAIEPLVRAYPGHLKVLVLGCRIELAHGGARAPATIEVCEQALAASGEIEPATRFAAARLAAGDAAGARTTLVAAEARIASLAPDQATAAWLRVAEQYRAMGALTWTEAALAQAGVAADAHNDLAAWAKATRARYGIPRDGARWKLVPEDEAAATDAVRQAVSRVNADDFDAATKMIAAAEQRWPALPGLLTARCALDYRRGAIAAARKQCDRAIAQGPSSWALYLRATMELERSRAVSAATIAQLREVIALDPDLTQAWRALGQALERTRATAELEQLRRDYHARFNSRLPVK